MPPTPGSSPACSHANSPPFFSPSALARGTSTMPSSGVQEAKETNGEGSTFGPQSSRTMQPLSSVLVSRVLSHLHRPGIKRFELAEPPSFSRLLVLWLPNHPSLTSPHWLSPPIALSTESSSLSNSRRGKWEGRRES